MAKKKITPKKPRILAKKKIIPQEVQVLKEKQTEVKILELSDRMMRHSRPTCPECDSFPVACTMKRVGYAAFRCRVCGHRWENK